MGTFQIGTFPLVALLAVFLPSVGSFKSCVNYLLWFTFEGHFQRRMNDVKELRNCHPSVESHSTPLIVVIIICSVIIIFFLFF